MEEKIFPQQIAGGALILWGVHRSLRTCVTRHHFQKLHQPHQPTHSRIHPKLLPEILILEFYPKIQYFK